MQDIKKCNIYIIAVPTPVDEYNTPDLTVLGYATETVASVISKQDIIIYESTVYPGATEEYCVPLLEKKSGLKYNLDFSCGYSPERINPGDHQHTLTKIVKITSASNAEAANLVDRLYKSIITAGTHKVSSIAIAEAAKVIENVQRDVNIALINELSMIFNRLSLDTGEILEAARTKWNFLPFKPGLVGGHCIGVDPYYLTYKAQEIGYNPEMILAGRRINDSMATYICEKTISEMAKNSINPVGAKIGVLGLTFKENCPDLRNTKVPNIIKGLKSYNCNVIVSDPYADINDAKNLYNINILSLDEILDCDAIILAVSHIDYTSIVIEHWNKMFAKKAILIDIKSVYNKKYFYNSNIVYWAL